MDIIIVTEIWGRTQYVEAFASSLGSSKNRIRVIDPYDGYDPKFVSEEDAYSTFTTACGHDGYAEQVCLAISQQTAPVCLVGFSAGAGAVWSAVCRNEFSFVKGAICFYGSSIRKMTELSPSVPVELIFSEYELHFEVKETIKALEHKPKVTCHVAPYRHGFMNPLSVNYDTKAYHQWLAWTQNRISLYCNE